MAAYKKFIAEAVSTGSLIFIGAGAVLTNAATGGALGPVGIALAHGLVILVMVYAIAQTSGAHINPAVTIALWARGKISTPGAVMYVVAQLGGATVGAWLLGKIFPEALGALHLGAPALAPFIGRRIGVLLEALLTAILMWTILGATDKRSGTGATAGLPIGFAITLGVLMGGPLTGAALNPARSFGPALVSGFWTNHWVYWVGPVLGALIAAYLYRLTTGAERD